MANSVLVKLPGSDRVRRLTTDLIVTRAVVHRVVAGSGGAGSGGVSHKLPGQCFAVIIERRGEDVTDRQQADAAAHALISR